MTTLTPRNTRQLVKRHTSARSATVLGTVVAIAFGLTGASVAPARASGETGSTTTTSTLPTVFPAPQEMHASGDQVPLSGKVLIVTGDNPDASTVALVSRIVTAAGGNPVVSRTATGGGKRIYLGTVANNPAIDDAVDGLGAKNATGLKADGYVLASGRYDGYPTVALNGVDQRGTYYAAQTLRQLITHKVVPGVSIRDWPLMSIRGAIEGFYGIPWSHQARLDQMAFYGEHKMNTYIYTPKDDQLLRAKWRTPYSGAALDRMKELVKTANDIHVDFTFALSPGNDICYSSDADLKATEAKFDQLRSLGVRSFYIALDDIPLSFHCAADKAKYPDNGDWHWLADAQADYLNRINQDYIKPNGLAPLQTVPTNYNGSGPDPYKAEFGTRLDDDVLVQWTGEGVFSDTITAASVQRASTSYNTDHLYIWDNFPVNDGKRGRLFLNPLTGRAPDLYKYIDGITSNPMIEPYASMPALANYGDYTWNGPKYDANASMSAVLDELAGPDQGTRTALRTFADLNQEWPYRASTQKAPALSKDIAAFWQARSGGSSGATPALDQRLAAIVALPRTLAGMAQPGFARDAAPWVNAAAKWATALQHEIAMLTALDAGDGSTATREYFAAQDAVADAKKPTVPDQGSNGEPEPNQIVPSVGDGAFEAFTTKANNEFISWLGAKPIDTKGYSSTPSSSMGTYSSYGVSKMTDNDPSSYYWSNAAPSVGSNVQVDLGATQQVGSVVVRQSDSDSQTGDMIYHAALDYSTDGEHWTTAAEFDTKPVVRYTFDTPVQARYVRLRATALNPGGKWVKIRDFAVSATSPVSSNLPAANGSGAADAFDADLGTAYQAGSKPVEGSFLARTYADPVSLQQVSVVGTGAGELQVQHDGTWTTIGALAGVRHTRQVTSTRPGR
ncbi:beta-N-acetylglucosaminidase domain-containing protein [Flexivirga alba]|uniref:Beta-N-acetylglucosaminidase domain-containing protein n=1 Tax=Flexivirga alba TaxID=702742 RepID=A0ABW2AM80_9MICO